MRHLLLLVLIIGFSFSPCLKAGFVSWDDDYHVFNNPQIKTVSVPNTLSIFQTAVNKTYIPLTTLSFSIEHFFFGPNPFVFHLTNVIGHIIICLIIYAILGRMGLDRRTAFLTALLFGIHPMHVESVAWTTQRKDILYTLFYLLSMLGYWDHLTQHKQRAYWASIFFGFLSILSKPMALSLPLTLLILDWYSRGRITKTALLNKIPYLLLIVPIAWITYSLNARVPFGDPMESFLIWSWSATFYIKKFLTPFVLLPLYQLPQPVSIFNPSYASSVLMLVAFPVMIWFFRRDRLFLFACAFYAASTFFLWRFDNTVDITIVADRFMYLPSLGICLWLAHRAVELLKISRIRPVVIAVGLFLIIKTFLQCGIWQNDITLWSHVIKHNATSAHAFNSRGAAFGKSKRYDEALSDLDRAIALRPDHALSYYNRGIIYKRLGQPEKALHDYNRALKLNPRSRSTYINRATIWQELGYPKEAAEDLKEAQRLNTLIELKK